MLLSVNQPAPVFMARTDMAACGTGLRAGVTLLKLQQMARSLTDVQVAAELNETRQALLRKVPARTG